MKTFVRCWPDRTACIVDVVMTQLKSLEFSDDFLFPQREECLPDTSPRFPRKNDDYYSKGGQNWPVRWIFHAG